MNSLFSTRAGPSHKMRQTAKFDGKPNLPRLIDGETTT